MQYSQHASFSAGGRQTFLGGTSQQDAEVLSPAIHGRDTFAHIWAGWAGWRVVLMVFVTVFLIQGLLAYNMLQAYAAEQLAGLRAVAHAAILPVVNDIGVETPAAVERDVSKLLHHTTIRGFAVYGMIDAKPVYRHGLLPALRPVKNRVYHKSAYVENGSFYDVIYTPSEIGQPYNAAVRLDASDVVRNVTAYGQRALEVILFLSVLLTVILIIAMNQLLLAPLLKRNDRLLEKMHLQAEDKIYRLAYFDGLTGLPNRTYFLENLDKSIEQKAYGEDGIIAVLSVDIDHFKDINDSLGHEVGDRLLEVVGARLVKALPAEAVVARLSADEFAMMMPMAPEADISVLADRVFATMQDPVEIMQESFLTRVSVGVSRYPQDGDTAREILKNADIALNRAKNEGRGTAREYSQDFSDIVKERAQMVRDLRKALDEKQLQLFYHPQFDIRTGEIVGAEALLRWIRPASGPDGGSQFISPAEFIPAAEQSGLIVPIGEWVLHHACARAKAWRDAGVPPLRMAVNISGVQFHRVDIVRLVEDVLGKTKLPPEWLELELTESIFIEDAQSAIDIMDQLHQLGVQLAVDDFGTGYSSLSYLRQFPIDRLKIDQSFVRASLMNLNDRMIIRAIVNLGHSLNLKIIAEGVEMKDHEDLLKEEGCDEVQGFKYSKPLPEDKFLEFVETYNENLANSKKVWMVE